MHFHNIFAKSFDSISNNVNIVLMFTSSSEVYQQVYIVCCYTFATLLSLELIIHFVRSYNEVTTSSAHQHSAIPSSMNGHLVTHLADYSFKPLDLANIIYQSYRQKTVCED
uniref:Uncharacterized protein n=1 Tax=Glossina brevipalpis TaxID=37001 RepID=A0A1A9VZU8_9MUSC